MTALERHMYDSEEGCVLRKGVWGLNTQVEECSVGWESIEKECMVMLITAVRSVKWNSSSVKQCYNGYQWEGRGRGSGRGRRGAVGPEAEGQ